MVEILGYYPRATFGKRVAVAIVLGLYVRERACLE
jgi:hypothetical protein